MCRGCSHECSKISFLGHLVTAQKINFLKKLWRPASGTTDIICFLENSH